MATLRHHASGLGQESQLCGVLNAIRDDLNVQRARQSDDCVHERRLALVGNGAGHETAGDFQPGESKHPDMVQRQPAGAELIEYQLHAKRLQTLQIDRMFARRSAQAGLGQLQPDQLGRDLPARQRLGEILFEAGERP